MRGLMCMSYALFYARSHTYLSTEPLGKPKKVKSKKQLEPDPNMSLFDMNDSQRSEQ